MLLKQYVTIYSTRMYSTDISLKDCTLSATGERENMFPVALWSPSSWWLAGRIHMNQDISKVKIYYSKEKSVDTKRKRYTQANTTEAFFVLHLQGWHGHSCLLEWKSHEKKDTNHAQKSLWLNFQANNFLKDKIESPTRLCVHNVLASFMCHILPPWSTQDRNNCQFLSFTRRYSLVPNNPCNLEFPFF